MKKRIIVISAILAVAGIALGVVGYKMWHSKTENDTSQNEGIHYVGDQWYSREENEWASMKVKEKITYLDNGSSLTLEPINICTSFKDAEFISVDVPNDREYITDLGSAIYAVDGSLKIVIYDGNIEDTNLNIDNAVAPERNIIYTDDESKTVHVVANYLKDDLIIVGYVYSNSNDWTAIRDSITSIESYTDSVSILDVELNELPTPNKEIKQTVFIESKYSSDITRFVNGQFKYSQIAYSFDKTKLRANEWISAMANNYNIEKYIDSKNEIFYAHSDNGYTIGVMRWNESYLTVMYGFGDEAMTNILYILTE